MPRRLAGRPGPRRALLVPLGDGQDLRHGEADGGRDGDTVCYAVLQHVQGGGGGRELHRDVGGPGPVAAGHRHHGLPVARAPRVHLAADITQAPFGRLVLREEHLRGSLHDVAHQLFGAPLVGQVLRHSPEGVRPDLGAAAQGASREQRVRGDAGSGVGEARPELVRIGRIVPPGGGCFTDQPLQIAFGCHDAPLSRSLADTVPDFGGGRETDRAGSASMIPHATGRCQGRRPGCEVERPRPPDSSCRPDIHGERLEVFVLPMVPIDTGWLSAQTQYTI